MYSGPAIRVVGVDVTAAVTSAAEKKEAVAIRDLFDPLETPHKKCPLVQPDPSW